MCRSDTSAVLVMCFFFNDTATTEIYTLSLHDALPISHRPRRFPDHGALDLPPGLDLPTRDDGADGRHGPAGARYPGADRVRGRPDRAPVTAARRHPPGHPHHRGDRHGRRCHHPAGPVRVRLQGRAGRARPLPRWTGLHRAAPAVPGQAQSDRGRRTAGHVRFPGTAAMRRLVLLLAGLAVFLVAPGAAYAAPAMQVSGFKSVPGPVSFSIV